MGLSKQVQNFFIKFIHGAYESHTFLLLYALLPNKTTETYTCLFRELKALRPGLAPKTVLMDFELAVMNVFTVRITICLPPQPTRFIFFEGNIFSSQIEFPLIRQSTRLLFPLLPGHYEEN